MSETSVPPTQPPAAPDPTAGERVHWIGEHNNTLHGNGYGSKDMEHASGDEDEVTCKLCLSLLAREDVREWITPASPPAVAASTGTSEDVEWEYVIDSGWLVQVVNKHTCGTGPDGYYGAHEPGCGTIPIADISHLLAAREAAARAEVVAGVRAWCAINEIAAPPLDWEGLGEFLARIAREIRT